MNKAKAGQFGVTGFFMKVQCKFISEAAFS